MSISDILVGVNSDVIIPMNHLIWLNDYHTYGDNSYVKNVSSVWSELVSSIPTYKLLANDGLCSDFYQSASDKRKFLDATEGFSGIDFGNATSIKDALDQGIITIGGLVANDWFKKHYMGEDVVTSFPFASNATLTIEVNGSVILISKTVFDCGYDSTRPTITVYFSDGTTTEYKVPLGSSGSEIYGRVNKIVLHHINGGGSIPALYVTYNTIVI